MVCLRGFLVAFLRLYTRFAICKPYQTLLYGLEAKFTSWKLHGSVPVYKDAPMILLNFDFHRGMYSVRMGLK